MATNTNANIGFEKQIWDAACVLRGNMDASEYKSVVLGLIFLKYISDRFEAKHNELVEEGDGFEEDKDEYTAENIFFVPAERPLEGDRCRGAHSGNRRGHRRGHAQHREGKQAPQGHSAQELCPARAGQAPPGRGGGPVHQHSDGGARQ